MGADADRPNDRNPRSTAVPLSESSTAPEGLAGADASSTRSSFPTRRCRTCCASTHLHNVLAAVAVAGESSRVSQDIVRLLRARHKLGPEDPDDFTVKPQARDAVMGKGINPMLARAVMGSVVGLDKITLEEMARTLERSSRTMTRAARERRGRVPAGRRHRHHEHHARLGDRAHARDRPADGASARAAAMC